jgi:hypothetical protein
MELTGRQIRDPFDGDPKTWEETGPDGQPEFHIAARVLTPWRAKVADTLGELTAVTVPVGLVLYMIDHEASVIAMGAGAATYFLRALFEKAWRELLKRKVQMMVTAEEFRFRRFMHWVVFDRSLPHKFSLKIHDLA